MGSWFSTDKPWVGKVTAAIVGVMAAILFFEIVIRLTPYAEPHTVTYDAVRGWQLIPGGSGWHRTERRQWITINRAGLRDVNHSLKKSPGTFRIAVLGDSYAEADVVPMRDAFWWVMQQRLRACPALAGRRVEAINFGVRGYGTAQELLTLRDHVWQYSPDFVLLAIYTGNDIRNNFVRLEVNKCRPFYFPRAGGFVLKGPFTDSRWFRFKCFVRFESRYSQTADIAGDGIITLRNLVRSYTRKHEPPPGSQIGPGFSTDPVYAAPINPVWSKAWRVTDWEITQVARNVARHKAGFLAVTLSNPVQVYPDPSRRHALAELMGVPDLFYPDRRIAALGQREGFPVLTLAPTMQAYADAHHAYLHGFAPDSLGRGHWNALGHRVAGKLIAERICRMLSGDTGGRSAPERTNAAVSSSSGPLSVAPASR
jgi:hypothetical protein